MLLTLDTAKNISQFLTLLVIMAFVLVITYCTTRYIAGYQKEKQAGGNMSLLEAIRLNQRQYIQLVKIGSKYFALAISKDTTTVICEVPESELKFDESPDAFGKFADVLKKFKERNSADDNGTTAEDTSYKMIEENEDIEENSSK